MRVLNKRQKNYLTKVLEDDQSITTIDDLGADDFYKLQEMNDHETFYQNVDRFITDVMFSR